MQLCLILQLIKLSLSSLPSQSSQILEDKGMYPQIFEVNSLPEPNADGFLFPVYVCVHVPFFVLQSLFASKLYYFYSLSVVEFLSIIFP